MGLLDALKAGAEDIAKSAGKNKVGGAIDHVTDSVKGFWNPNHRHDEPDEIAADKLRTEICASHRFGSFAPERNANIVKWFVDGHDYFYAVSELLDSAEQCIFILDWWLSPEIYLRRPPCDNEEWRLDRLLKRKAAQGVKIYVIVYKEVTQGSANSSRHTKNALQELHDNVSVMRHPDHIGAVDTIKIWSHHEKLIVVDNYRACIGGLDLCFGRWDTHNHPLSDVHPTDFSRTLFPGQDYNNGRVMDFQQVDNYVSNQISLLDTGRMPWHDVHLSLMGTAVIDAVQHFTERWNEIKKRKERKNPKYDWLALPNGPRFPNEPISTHPHLKELEDATHFRSRWHDLEDEFDPQHEVLGRQRLQQTKEYNSRHPISPGTCDVQILRSSCDWSHGILVEHSIQTAYIDLIREANHFIYIENQFFISNTGDKKSPIVNHIAEALVQRILQAAHSGTKFKVIVVIPEVPGFAGDIKQQDGLKTIMAAQWRTMNRGGTSIYEKIRDAGYEPLDYIRFYHLRTYDRLNAPASFIAEVERNSQKTFYEAQIAQARLFIGDDGFWHQTDVKIRKPSAFAGLDDKNLGMTEKQSTEEVQSVPFPETTKLAQEIVDTYESGAPRSDDHVSDSIAHHRLQDVTELADENWLGSEQEERDCYITELIYIHSKLMIVDDRRVIMGSANLNDRSQKGDGDSEIAICVEDRDLISTKMDGKAYMAGRFAATLRRRLFREHLGLIPPQNCFTGKEPIDAYARAPPVPHDDEIGSPEDKLVEDPLSEEMLGLWYSTARVNREIFSQIFRTVPSDNVRNWEQYKNYVPKVKTGHIAVDLPLDQVKERLSMIKGGLVEAPLNFLIEQQELVASDAWEGVSGATLPIYV